jgi:hypothetical protein
MSQPVIGWGDVGHRAVAYLAEKYLTDQGSDLVSELLANNKGYDISDAATWADTIKWKRPSTRPWHYIDAKDDPPTSCSLTYKRDCSDEGCIVSAMESMTHGVNDPNMNKTEQKEALMFLIHFFGDIHQPLHVEDKEKGGNGIEVCFDKQELNLHAVWDTAIPHKINGVKHNLKHNAEKEASARWADRLYERNRFRPMANECSNIRNPLKCVVQWAAETNWLICNFVLQKGIPWLEHHDLGGQYYKKAEPIVEEQILKAALRLAVWINTLAADRASSTEPLLVQNEL